MIYFSLVAGCNLDPRSRYGMPGRALRSQPVTLRRGRTHRSWNEARLVLRRWMRATVRWKAGSRGERGGMAGNSVGGAVARNLGPKHTCIPMEA